MQGKKHVPDKTWTYDLERNITVLPQGHEGSLELIPQKAWI